MALKVDIFARNMEVTERINDYVTKKLSKLDRFLTDIDVAQVDLDFIKHARNAADRQIAQITIRGKGYILRTEERADDIFAAVDAAVDKMQRQIERYKGKRSHGRGDGKSAAEVSGEINEPEEVIVEGPVIVRRKSFTLVPMDELEAIEQMALLAHEDFFVFYNANTNSINVLYQRRDGTYGLIEPQLG
jgi:putative sigma-54 modulation protein